MEDYFFTKNPPKSTGPDYFNPRWIKNHIKNFKDLSPEDIQATLNELTVKTIFSELKKTRPDMERRKIKFYRKKNQSNRAEL